ncbi:MAG TPA: ATP-dependent helicase HrpB [bacterium]|nr:ATP-dependent helicase HrpB [bacterium]
MAHPLPIDPLLPEVLAALEKGPSAVLVAEPGAGKTTRVPPALLSAPFTANQEVWVLQPRRIAAKLAALRVAEELGEEVGAKVGYHFRFEKRTGPSTRLKFLTDGMLLPLAQSDPSLSRVACVVLDEFHERSLALDLGLGYLRRLQKTSRPDLRLLVMSATLDSDSLAAYLDGCPVLKSPGRVFPVEIQYEPFLTEKNLDQKVRSAISLVHGRGGMKIALVFLPGVGEIRRCQKALAQGPWEVHALYGDLPLEEQQRVLKPSNGPKVILSTNIAETSLTVPGVTAVVDAGLNRQARVSPWSGLESLVTVPASQASAAQRAGRAGRLEAGTCLRLYSKFDFEHRAAFDVPEILRSDLSKALLDLKQLGVRDPDDFPWFQKPNALSLEKAHVLLTLLGATTFEGDLTERGRRMARNPLPPRLAAFLREAEELAPNDRSFLNKAARLASLISAEDNASVDLLEELERYEPGFEGRRLIEQLEGSFTPAPGTSPKMARDQHHDLLAKSLLAAFPDRVGMVRESEGSKSRDKAGRTLELVMAEGGMVTAPDGALTRGHGLFVVVEAQETERGARALSLAPIQADWLLDLFPDRLSEERAVTWNAKSSRVEGFQRLKYSQLILEEKPLGSGNLGPEGRDLLLKQALSAGPQAYCDPEALSGLMQRTAFVGERTGGRDLLSEAKVTACLKELCEGRASFKDLKEADLPSLLRSQLDPKDQALLEKLAPASVTLPSGRRMTVHYEKGKAPWGESRIQDFFGMKKGPAVGGGEVPLVLHLLSPAQRPVQVTSDLEGFWKNHYPQVRKELSRRYPRHKWPEDPA